MKPKKHTFWSIVTHLDAIITCVTLSICVVLVNINVITRYVLRKPIPGCEEIVTSFFVWTVFIGCAYAHRTRSHLGVDIVVNLMPPKMKTIVENLVLLIELAVLLMITIVSAQYVYFQMFSRSGAWKPALTDVLRFPKWWTVIAVPIGFGMSTLFTVHEILANRLHLIRKKAPAAGEHNPGQGGGAV